MQPWIVGVVLAAMSVSGQSSADGGERVRARVETGSDWTRFRGPNGSGISEGDGFPTDFGPDKNVVWRTAMPPGHSSPVIEGDRLYLTAADGEALVTLAVSSATGEILWRREAPRARSLRVDRRNHPASATPATDGTGVYVFFQDFGLIAYDRAGEERWKLPLGPFDNAYGMGSSPIVAEGLVILVCDQSNGSFMVAVDKENGRIRWRAERPESKSGHSTPVVYRPAGAAPQILVPGSFLLSGYDLASGEKLWWARGLAFEMKATPVVQGSRVFIHGTSTSAFEDSFGGAIPSFEALREHDADQDGRFARDEVPDVLAKRWFGLMDLDHDGSLDAQEWEYFRAARSSQGGMWAFEIAGRGDITGAAARWHYNRSIPQLTSPLLYRGVLYIVNDGGVMTALDPEVGTAVALARLKGAVDSYYASPVAAGGKMLVVSESGKAVVLRADGALSVLAVNELEDMVYATPALANGRLYLRTTSDLFCFGSAPATEPPPN